MTRSACSASIDREVECQNVPENVKEQKRLAVLPIEGARTRRPRESFSRTPGRPSYVRGPAQKSGMGSHRDSGEILSRLDRDHASAAALPEITLRESPARARKNATAN